MLKNWKKFKVSSDNTHHQVDFKPVYSQRFLSVLKFHEPGLAPVENESGAFHIHEEGEPAYSHRFLQTFGFYQNIAAVCDKSGWFHILPSGEALYKERFSWCGNFQEGVCAVRSFQGEFFHINKTGKKLYLGDYLYAGDFHDGYAVVQNSKGFHTHIDFQGNPLHGKWFVDLDVYHKGFARAKDGDGWFHIDFEGLEAYRERYKDIEPFYNGIARVETNLGKLLRITEEGKTESVLREELQDPFHQVSAELVSYWRFYTIQSANELQLFDFLPSTVGELSLQIGITEDRMLKLLHALAEIGFVQLDQEKWKSTEKGAFLNSKHPHTLSYAAKLWKEEHLTCWKNLTQTLKTDSPAFDKLFGENWFDWLEDHPEKAELYHKALSAYAEKDYHSFLSLDLSQHRIVADIGGGSGKLLTSILHQYHNLQGILLDLPSVIDQVKIPSSLQARMQCLPAHFFNLWPQINADAFILSRVLHDWSDEKALRLLKQINLSMDSAGKLYMLEKIQEKDAYDGALLNLNMLVMTGGKERTLEEFDHLLKKADFSLEGRKKLNEVTSVLVARKRLVSSS